MNALKDIERVIIEPDDLLVSFNIVAMYTNIPIELAMKIIDKRWNDIKQYTSFFEALALCLKNSFFVYINIIYKQIEGRSMGSPISAILSEIVMDELFIEIKNKFSHKIKYITKYVDDSFLIIKEDSFDQTS